MAKDKADKVEQKTTVLARIKGRMLQQRTYAKDGKSVMETQGSFTHEVKIQGLRNRWARAKADMEQIEAVVAEFFPGEKLDQ